MKGYFLSARAERSLRNIFQHTIEYFGDAQAEAYRVALIMRLEALAAGRAPHGRPCSALIGGSGGDGLLYYKEGGHFIVYIETENSLSVADFIHERRDLAALIAGLQSPTGK